MAAEVVLFTDAKAGPADVDPELIGDHQWLEYRDDDAAYGCRMWGAKTQTGEWWYPYRLVFLREWTPGLEFLWELRGRGPGSLSQDAHLFSFERDDRAGPCTIVYDRQFPAATLSESPLSGDPNWFTLLLFDAPATYLEGWHNESPHGTSWVEYSLRQPDLASLVAIVQYTPLYVESDPGKPSHAYGFATNPLRVVYARAGAFPTIRTTAAARVAALSMEPPEGGLSTTAHSAWKPPRTGSGATSTPHWASAPEPPAFSKSAFTTWLRDYGTNNAHIYIPHSSIIDDVATGRLLPVDADGNLISSLLSPDDIAYLQHEFQNLSFALDSIERSKKFYNPGRPSRAVQHGE